MLTFTLIKNVYNYLERLFNQLDEISKMILLDRLFEMLQLNKSFSEKIIMNGSNKLRVNNLKLKFPH